MLPTTIAAVPNYFAYPAFNGISTGQTAALKSVSDHYVGLGRIVIESGVTGDNLSSIMTELRASQAVCNDALFQAWGLGKGTN